MKMRKGVALHKLSLLLISVGLAGGLSACTTTKVVKMTEAAPVTYKVGESISPYASVRMPERAPSPATSLPFTAPSTSPLAVPPRAAPQPTQAIDLSNIDRGLYDHMKVGKTYKVAGQTYHPRHNPDYDKIGVASWYGDKFHGKPTANGEVYDKNAMTAAHKTLPLNSYVYVTNLDTGKSLKVRLNDRGPFIDGRIIDLSEAAATILDIRGEGLGRVRVQYAGAAPITDRGMAYVAPQATQLTERAPSPAPAPVKTPEPAPEIVAVPQVAQQGYTPLRDLDETPSYVAAPDQQTYVIPDPMTGMSENLSIALPQQRSADAFDMPPIPKAPETAQDDDGVVTLTIKGPIHMARSDDQPEQRPEFIPASFNGEK